MWTSRIKTLRGIKEGKTQTHQYKAKIHSLRGNKTKQAYIQTQRQNFIK